VWFVSALRLFRANARKSHASRADSVARAQDNAYILGNPAANVKFAAPVAPPADFPMILSMTGFAAAAAELPGASLAVELRSVNHRFLDVSLRLPDELRTIEPGVRETISGALRRGKVDCRVSLNRTQASAVGLSVDEAQVRKLATAASEVAKLVPDAAPLTVNEVLRWPGVLAEPAVDPVELAARALALVDQALGELAAARQREGAKTAAVLEQCCLGIEFQVARVMPRVPAVHAAYNDKLAARLREAGLDPNEDRLKQELALFATKVDVAEELARLTAHVAEVRRVIRAGGSAGKRLDFLAQELHREANTLGSKSVDAEVSQAALELKVLIEQMREQVQNVE
jgi:uncharacterized protein (TIGR00255 family)